MVNVLLGSREPQAAQEFLRAMQRRHAQLEHLQQKYWNIYGGGLIGAKAEELLRYAWAIEKAGFVVLPRVVLAMEFFSNFLATGKFNANEIEIIKNIVQRFHGVPIAVRSSAHGDSEGSGIYESTFCANCETPEANFSKLLEAIAYVLESHNSPKAVAFRKDCKLPDGIAIMIEPVFGRRIENDYGKYYGPDIGLIAYSDSSEGAYLRFTSGLPNRVVQGEGFRVLNGDERTINKMNLRIVETHGGEYITRTLFNSDIRLVFSWLANGDCIDLSDGELFEVDFPKNVNSRANFSEFFRRLELLGKLSGKKFYVEGAIVDPETDAKISIIQISELTQNSIEYKIAYSEKTFANASHVINSGIVDSTEVVLVTCQDERAALKRYNRTHSGYVLVLDPSLISRIGYPLSYDEVNNAAIIAELGSYEHATDLDSHFGGAPRKAGKILLTLDRFDLEKLKPFQTEFAEFDYVSHDVGLTPVPLTVFGLKNRTTANERKNQAVIEVLD